MSLITLTKAVGLDLAWTSRLVSGLDSYCKRALRSAGPLNLYVVHVVEALRKAVNSLVWPSPVIFRGAGIRTRGVWVVGRWWFYRVKMFVFIKRSRQEYFFPWSFQLGNRPEGFYISSSLGLRQLIVPRKVWSIVNSLQPPPPNLQKLMGRWNSTASLKAFFINTQVHFKAFTSLSENRSNWIICHLKLGMCFGSRASCQGTLRALPKYP